MKIAVIARCKNEIQNLQEWLDNKKFSDLFFITDNESTDGSFEFLSNQKNVIVKSVKGFDEGRDFQILLNLARTNKVDWVFKFDCDEFVGEDFASQLNYIINKTDYDCIRLRKISKHFKASNDKGVLTREYFHGGVYGTRLTSEIDISDRRIHVGSFCFYKKSIVISSLVTHFWVRSKEDAIERARIYSLVDKTKNYKIKDEVPNDILVDLEVAANSQKFKKFNDYGVPFLVQTDRGYDLVKPKLNQSFLKQELKHIIWLILSWFGLLKYYLNFVRK